MLREDSSEVSKDAADRLGAGTELKPLDNSQKYRTCSFYYLKLLKEFYLHKAKTLRINYWSQKKSFSSYKVTPPDLPPQPPSYDNVYVQNPFAKTKI